MTNPPDLRTLDRVRQQMVWQTVIAAEKAAIAVFAAKNRKRRQAVVAADPLDDPLKTTDVDRHLDHFDSSLLDLDTPEIDTALLPYSPLAALDRDRFLREVDKVFADHKDDPLFKSVDGDVIKGLVYKMATARLALSQQRRSLTDKAYLSTLGFDTALTEYEDFAGNIAEYNAMLAEFKQAGGDVASLSPVQNRASYRELKSMLHEEQDKLQAMLNAASEGRRLGGVDPKVVADLRTKYARDIEQAELARDTLRAELERRNRFNDATIYWEKIPQEIKLANRKITELRALADKRALETGNALYEREAQLENQLSEVRQRLIDHLQPENPNTTWFTDLLMNPPDAASDEVKQLIEHANDIDEQLIALQDEIKDDDGWSVSDAEPEEDLATNQQIDNYRQQLFSYLEQTFGVTPDQLEELDTPGTTDLLAAFQTSDKTLDAEPVTVTLDGETITVTITDEIEALLEKVNDELEALDVQKSSVLTDADQQREVIDTQVAHIEDIREALTVADLKNIFTPASMTREELTFFRFIKAAVLADQERKRQLAHGDPDLTDPDISFAMYQRGEQKDAVDTGALLTAYRTGSFESMKYVAPQLNNISLDGLRTSRSDYELFNRMPIDELLKKVIRLKREKLAVKERQLQAVNERIATGDRFNQLYSGGMTYDQAQLHVAQLKAQLDLVEANLETLEKAMATKVALPVPDPKTSPVYAPFVQGLNKAVRFEPVKIGNTDTIKVALVDFDAVPTPVTAPSVTPPLDESIPLFVDYDPYIEMENLLRQKEGVPVGQRLGEVAAAALDILIHEVLADEDMLKPGSFISQFVPAPVGTTVEDSTGAQIGEGTKVTFRYGDNPDQEMTLTTIKQHPAGMRMLEMTDATGKVVQVLEPQIIDGLVTVKADLGPTVDAPVPNDAPVTVVGLQDAKGQPVSVGDTGTYMGDPVTVTKIGVDQVEMRREIAVHALVKVTVGNFQSNFLKDAQPSAPVEPTPEVPEITTTPSPQPTGNPDFVDAKGAPLTVGDKVRLGGLQDGTIKTLSDKGMTLQVRLPSVDGKERYASQFMSWADVKLLNVVRLGGPAAKVVPLQGKPIPEMKPSYLNPVVLQKLQAEGLEMAPFYRVNFALPENALLRDQLIRMVLAYIDAHRDDPEARKILACIPLHTSKGKMSPALVERLVQAGYKREDAEGWSENTARAMLIHVNFTPNSLDASTRQQLKELGWSDAEINGMAPMQAFMYLSKRIRRPADSEAVNIKAAKLEETVKAQPLFAANLQPQSSVVQMYEALRNTAKRLKAEIAFAEQIKLDDVTQYQKLRDRLTQQVSELRMSLNQATDVGKIKPIPGLTEREVRYHAALRAVLGTLREAMKQYGTMVRTTKDPNATKFLNQLRVDVESYQTEINQLNQKSDNFKAQQEVDEYIANPHTKARRLGVGLPTLEQFEDRVAPTFEDEQYDIDIVPHNVAPEDHLNVRLTTPSKAPAKTEKGRPTTQTKAPAHSKKGHGKPNLRLKNFMKLTDFLKQNR